MAWLTRENPRSYSRTPKDPDMETLSYWLARIEPLIRAETEGEIIVVFANRTGTEEEAVYAGTSAVLGIQAGEVKVYGILGRGEKELLVVDTNKLPQAKLVSEPNSTASEAQKSTLSDKSDASLNTEVTACTSPEPVDCPTAMGDIITPLSPVDPTSPNAYFATKGCKSQGSIPRENLKSSSEQNEFPAPPDSPPFRRPSSPKSRNASRTRQLEQLEQQESPVSHDMTDEEQMTQKVGEVQSPPYSAAEASDRYISALKSSAFGSRSTYTFPRPKSTVW